MLARRNPEAVHGILLAWLPALAAISLAACAGSVSHTPTSRAPERIDAVTSRTQPTEPPEATTHAEPIEDASSNTQGPAEPEAPSPPKFSDEERVRIANMQRFVRAAAKKHDLPASLINAVIWVESRFTTRARGHRGPRGLMQIMPKTGRHLARELGRRYEPYSADFNIDAGAYYLARMIEQFDGDVALGLSAYATGPARVRTAVDGGEPLSERAKHYARKVLVAQAAFEEEDF
jgi:soluble lytic murein transglycosylase-like protein